MPRTILIGGSAGSLAAIQNLFESLPTQCGSAYVVIQHLSPQFSSQLDALVSKWTAMPVLLAQEGTQLQPDHVYIGVPGRFMSLKDRALHLQIPDRDANQHNPIDFLCLSLAAELGPDAALVILSGTGHDGTEGARVIKENEGTVIVQAPSSASFDGMPLSALEAGLVDQALAPDEIAAFLCSWGQLTEPVADTRGKSDEEAFDAILAQIRAHALNDMSGYKPTTLRRRIERRMGLRHASSLDAYLQILRQTPAELDLLARDLLIGVTAFFRDLEAFRIMEEEVIPRLCEAKDASDSVRVWVAGCSTGEEAYSIAIMLMEWFSAHGQPLRIQIFATDIDDAALEIGRAGIYGKDALAGVSPDRIKRFFNEDANGYRITKNVRETIVFASHNLISDPPFSRLDLVVCRNLLIYLNNSTQKKLLSLFHFVLNPGGYLFLGSSESIGSVGRHFHAVSKQWRIFRHLSTAPRRPPLLPITSGMGARRLSGNAEASADPGTLAGQERLFRKLLEIHGPTQVLVNSRHELLFVSGDASPYLTIPVGQASHDLFKMAKPAMAMALRSAINGAQRSQSRTAVSAITAESEGMQQGVRIEVTPILTSDHQNMFLVCFSPEAASKSALPLAGSGGDDWILQQLIQELNATREDLQGTIEQSRISSEEMKASNEEVMAMNEELQSANEELESSKEELQSLNEELVTSNANLDVKVVEVEALNADLGNLLNSTDTPTLLLGEGLCIRRFTPACARLLRIIPGDIGRAIDDVVRLFNDPDLSEDCLEVLRGIPVADLEIRDFTGRWCLRRILPYRGLDGSVTGVVLTFPDITSLKQAELLLHERAEKLQWQADLLSRAAPVVGLDLDNHIIFWNKGAQDLYGWSEDEALGKVAHDLLLTGFPSPLEQIRSELIEHSIWKGELTHVAKNGTAVVVESQWTLYRNGSGEVQAIVEVNINISDRKKAQEALRENEIMFHTMVDWTYNWEYWVNPDGSFVYMTPSVERITGYRPDEFLHNPGLIDAIVYAEDAALWERHSQYHLKAEREDQSELEMRIVRKNGEIRWVSHACRPVLQESGQFLGRRVTVRDISAQKAAEEQIRNLAYFDPLTHLPNRRLLMDRLGQALISSKRSMQFGALLVLDLDHFKSLNDTRGHDIGDRLLVEVAQRLIENVRQEDSVARLGGDEFVVMLEALGTSEQAAASQAETVSEKVRLALNQPYFLGEEEAEYYNTPSIGLTLFRGVDNSAEVLLKQADVALYQAKDAGRNVVRYFNPAMQSAIDATTALEAALRRGLDRREFSLYYQPQMDNNGHVLGAEALIRWMPQDDALVSPAQFIPLAEETGLILLIGLWVLDTACCQLKAWEGDPRCRDLFLSVNVSARQFHQNDFVEQVRHSLAVSGANPARLKLELTESVVLNNVSEVTSRMRQLIEMGVSFALDDFGTGYSSLSYLKRLPLSQVKIDKSFVRDVTEDTNDAAIVSAILAMTRSLGLQVIAEGVETAEQRDFLLRNGCMAYQGYLFGRPMPIAAWDRFLDSLPG